MIKDARYIIFYFFTASIISGILALEDLFDTEDRNALDFIILYVQELPLNIFLVVLCSFISSMVIDFFNKILPWERALFKRFMIEIGTLLLLVGIFTVITVFLYRSIAGNQDPDDDLEFELVTIIMFFIGFTLLFSLHEFMKLSEDNQVLKLQGQVLQKQNYVTKYEALRNQINPHFLFNSLNVLSTLVYIDAKKADQFIKKFSEVFRYVLELNQKQVIKLKDELKFIESYLYLHQIRFGDNLIVNYDVNADALNKWVPPLSLQVVIENAIKHNTISKDSPLVIDIEANCEWLYVRNNYQMRDQLRESTGVGQQNLHEKYALLSHNEPRFYRKANAYVAEIPLIESDKWPK